MRLSVWIESGVLDDFRAVTAMDMQIPALVVSGTSHREQVRAAHEALDRFAEAYPDAVPTLCAWISAQLPAQVDEAGALPTDANTKASSGRRCVRSTTNERSDILSPVIVAATAAALDPDCPHSVWAAMVRMAEAIDKPAPLIGYSSDGIQYAGRKYQAAGTPDVLTAKLLADRMRRKRNRIQ